LSVFKKPLKSTAGLALKRLYFREAIGGTMGAEIGWGNFQLIEYDFEIRKLQIRVKNSAFAEAYGDSTEGVCHLISGVLSGLAAVLFARNCIASETECLAKGDKHCVFHISEK
jgi:predicted hydrocarbon binding protein